MEKASGIREMKHTPEGCSVDTVFSTGTDGNGSVADGNVCNQLWLHNYNSKRKPCGPLCPFPS